MSGRIQQVQAVGQSIWLDDLGRGLLQSRELERLRELGVTGITSNPTIFQKSISDSSVYDQGVRRLTAAGRSPEGVMWDLIIEDVSAAADVLRPVFEQTGGRDGFVSIEVSPEVAHSAERTVAMVRELRRRCDRANVMVKIPATREGLSAIRQSIAEGANINVTLIFAVSRYEEVVEAFLAGLEDLARKGGRLDQVRSVASFFVSRVDAKVDAAIDRRLAGAPPAVSKRLHELRGRIGIANSKLAYRRFRELHAGPRWAALAGAGAAVQRCLWASTSVKDPRYPDTLYVDSLIGPDTVDTMPQKTFHAFLDHGEVRRTLDAGVEEAEQRLDELTRLGIDLNRITEELEGEGVAAFEHSYRELLQTITEVTRAVEL